MTDQTTHSATTRGPSRAVVFQYALAILVAMLVAAPLLPIVYQSFLSGALYDADSTLTLRNYARLFEYAELPSVAINSVLFSVLATLIAQVVGVTAAILLGRTDMPGRRFFGAILLWPLFISHLVLAVGWVLAYGPTGIISSAIKLWIGPEPWNLYSLAGAAMVEGVALAPFTILFCLGSTALGNAALEDAARCCGASPWRTLTRVTLPLLKPAILYSGMLNFTSAIDTLAVPLVLGEPAGIHFFATFIYQIGISAPQPNYGVVGVAAVLLLVIVSALVWLQARMLGDSRRFVTLGGKAGVKRVFRLNALRWPAFALVMAYAVFAIIVPMGTLIIRSLVSFLSPLVPFWTVMTLDNYVMIFTQPDHQRAILNTLFIAVVGAGIATTFYAFIAIVAQRSDFRFRRPLEYVALAPRAVPGLIAGLGFFYAMLIFPPMTALSGTVGVVMFAYVMRYIPTGFAALSPSLLQIEGDMDRAARVAGAGWITVSWRIVRGLIKPALVSCYCILFIAFLKEYNAALFLRAPGNEVIGTSLITYWVGGQMGVVAALSVFQIAVTAIFIALARKFWKVDLGGAKL